MADDLKTKTKKLHELAVEQIKCVDDYFNKMIELERILSDCRMNISTAKAQNGFALSSVGFIDNRDIEPMVLVNVNMNEGKFELVHPEILEESKDEAVKEDAKSDVRKRGKKENLEKEKEKTPDENDKDKTDEKKKENKSIKSQFRPFGLLEPRSAKLARAKADEAIQRACELSTIQSKIFSLEKSISQLNSEVMESLGDEYHNVLKINETSKPVDSVKKLLKEVKWIQMPAAS